jgi:2-polyprenyl-3-methyl-5-hydroxy-6-metoxy-1,4-benzoquinol methylase
VTKSVRSTIGSLLPGSLKQRLSPAKAAEPDSAAFTYLQSVMVDNYQVRNLVDVSPAEFREKMEAFLALDDAAMEGYASPELQRGKSVRFTWPYDHDFGDFQVGPGTGHHRPSRVLAAFMNRFDALPERLDGLRVLDIGCYSGGTSLLMAAMGASVVAVEEVTKYVDCLLYLRDAFGVEKLEPRNLSLYDLTADEFQDAFDIVLFSGVLYHLSDPVLGMRISFDAVRPGGRCLLETAVTRSDARILEYAGKNEAGRGDAANWFYPSPLVVSEMMDEVGFSDIRTFVQRSPVRDRLLGVGTKRAQVDMLRAGLSVRTVR